MGLKLGSQVIPTISLYKSNGVVPQGVFEVPSNSGIYDVKSYAFARAEFEDNLYKRIDGDYNFSYYSNSVATSIISCAFAGLNITGVSLPNVTTTGEKVFFNCKYLTSIYLPKLTSIKRYVFANCTNLSSFSFPLCSNIGSFAFTGCIGLPSNLVLPSNFTNIDVGAFDYCSNLQMVQCLGAISVRGFGNCANLTSLNLPVCTYLRECSNNTLLHTVYAPNLISIGGYGLASCAIQSISFSLCSSVATYAFVDCRSLTFVNLPALSLVTTGVFMGCSSLETVNIPNCTGIGGYAFSGCRSLTTLSVPLCSFIGTYAFYYCTNFSTLYLASNSVVTLSGSNAFLYAPIYYSSKYGSIFVPASLVDAYKSATN